MYEKAYDAYKRKCEKLGLKPSSKEEIFGSEIVKRQNENRVNITELSLQRKQKAPELSETAKKALDIQINRRAPKRVKKTEKQLLRDEIRADKLEEKKIVKASKPEKQKRVLQTEDEKRLKRNAQARKQYQAKVEALGAKEHKVLLTDEQKLEHARVNAAKYYAKNKKDINAKNRQRRKENSPKVILSDEEKKQKAREYAKLHYLKMKNDPEFIEKRKANAIRWKSQNKEKMKQVNKEYMQRVRESPELMEKRRQKQREYRVNNLEKVRAEDRARKQRERKREVA